MAIGDALDAIRLGRAHTMFAGGAEPLKPRHHPVDRLALMRLGRFGGSGRAWRSDGGGGPVDLGGFQVTEQQHAGLLLLGLDGALGGVPDQVGGRDQEPEGELRPPRLGQERVHVALGDPVDGVVRLGLDRPQVSVTVLGDQVDTRISAPTARSLIPQPDPAQLARVDRLVGEEPSGRCAQTACPAESGRGYEGSGIGVHTPVKGRDLDVENRSYNTLLTAARAIGERANAELKQRWRCLRRIRLCPNRISQIVAAAVVLSTLQRGNY